MTLDELAAVKVMGWTRCSDDCPATGTCFFVDTDGSVWFHGGIVPLRPSTRIVDAWAVVENFETGLVEINNGWGWDESKGKRVGGWHVRFVAPGQEGEARAPSVEKAITLAALRACGVTEGEIEAAQEKNHA